MRCKTCHYSLANLTPTESGEHRCPECGREFDPNDPSTYESKPPSRWWLCLLLAIVYLAVLAGVAFLWVYEIRR